MLYEVITSVGEVRVVGHGPIHEDRSAGHVGGRVGGEEGDDAGDLFGIADPSQRDLLEQIAERARVLPDAPRAGGLPGSYNFV